MCWTQKFSFSRDPVILDLKLQLAENFRFDILPQTVSFQSPFTVLLQKKMENWTFFGTIFTINQSTVWYLVWNGKRVAF